jgi:hypothetical protein
MIQTSQRNQQSRNTNRPRQAKLKEMQHQKQQKVKQRQCRRLLSNKTPLIYLPKYKQLSCDTETNNENNKLLNLCNLPEP